MAGANPCVAPATENFHLVPPKTRSRAQGRGRFALNGLRKSMMQTAGAEIITILG
jgi:hypothetical protein